MELIRAILLKIEEDHRYDSLCNIEIQNYSAEEIAYHCKIMYQVGLVDYYDSNNYDDELGIFVVGGITWQGHDYLELIRNDEIWKMTKREVKEKKIPNTIEYIAKIAGKFTGAVISEL